MTPLRRVALASLVLSAAACDGGGKATPNSAEAVAGRVGVVLPTAAQPAYKALEEGLRKELDEAGHEIVAEAVSGVDEQVALLQQIAARKAAAIVVAPLDSMALRPAVDAALAASIPVFTLGLPVHGATVTTHVEQDHYAAGVVAAEYLTAFVGPGVHAGVVGRLGAHGSRELEAGFQSVMGLVDTRVHAGSTESGGTVEGAAAATAELLDRDPDLDAIFALDPLSAQGALSTAFARRRADLVIVSFGATQQTLDAIREARTLRAAIVDRPDEAARLLAEAITTQLEGEPVTPVIKVPVRLVNVDSLGGRP